MGHLVRANRHRAVRVCLPLRFTDGDPNHDRGAISDPDATVDLYCDCDTHGLAPSNGNCDIDV